MAIDGDIGANAKMTYSLNDDLEETSTFIIETDPVTQEGVVLLSKVNTYCIQSIPLYVSYICMYFNSADIFHYPYI